MENFRRRQGDVQRYNRAQKCLKQVTSEVAIKRLQKEIDMFNDETALIEWFMAQPHEVIEKGGRQVERVAVRVIKQDKDGKYIIVNDYLSCSLYGENYVEEWRNKGADYHALSLRSLSFLHHGQIKEAYYFLTHQDDLEHICEEMNLLQRNYF